MKINWTEWKASRLSEKLRQHKYVLLVIAAGIVLMAWPTAGGKASAADKRETAAVEEDFSVEALEERLSRVLSKIEGAGEVSVVLTVQNGTERILASNKAAEQTGERREMEEEIVLIEGEYGEEALLIGQRYPSFRGALVVCRGGDDPQVCLWITQAVSALTGLGTDKITVCKGA